MKNYDIPSDSNFQVKFEEACAGLMESMEQQFEPHLGYNSRLCDLLLKLHLYKRAEKVYKCGNYTAWAIPSDFSEQPFMVHANFCKDRLCSMCSWRRSLKIFSQVSQVMDEIEQDHRFLFVTLTLRSVPSGELSNALDRLSDAFHLFLTYAKVRKAFKGFFKAVEITRNIAVVEYEWHPHLHIIFAVDPHDYFKGGRYIPYKELRELWQTALGVEYAPQVDIRVLKEQPNEKPNEKEPSAPSVNLGKAVAEVAKYAVKSEDIFKGSEQSQLEAVLTLTQALRGRRLCAFGGIFKETARKLKLDDLEDGDLTDRDKLREDVHYLVVNCSWQVGLGFSYHLDKNIYTGFKRRSHK